MRICTLIITLFLCCTLAAQDAPAGIQYKNSIGLSTATNFSYRTLTGENLHFLIGYRDENEIADTKIQGGLVYRRFIGSSLFLETGLMYVQRGFRTKTEVKQIPENNPQRTIEAYLSFDYNYVEIPILLNYKFVQNRTWMVSVGTGIQIGFLTQYSKNAHVKTDTGFEESRDNQGNVGQDASAIFAVGQLSINRILAEKWIVTINLSYSHGITAANRSLDVKEKLYSVAPAIGLHYRF